jgi:serine/threonine-protein kinase
VFGTPAFMPPEQALGHNDEVDALSDVWAVGATAFCLLSGRFVNEGKTSAEMIVAAATRPAPPLASIAPWIPAEIAGVIDCALAFERGRSCSGVAACGSGIATNGQACVGGKCSACGEPATDGQHCTGVCVPPLLTESCTQSSHACTCK